MLNKTLVTCILFYRVAMNSIVGDSRSQQNGRWNRATAALGEVDRGEMFQMYVLPLECDLGHPSSDFNCTSNHARRTRVCHQTLTVTDQSGSGYCSSYCHINAGWFTTTAYVILLFALVCVVTALTLLVMTHLNISTLQQPVTVHLIPTSQSSVTVTADNYPVFTSNTPSQRTENSMIESLEPIMRSRTESLSMPSVSSIFTGAASTSTVTSTTHLTTPYQITQEQGCVSIPVTPCSQHLSYDTTFYPNRFNLGNTASNGVQLYLNYSRDINNICHPDSQAFLCRVLFPPCYTFPPKLVKLPCRSLCKNIGARCIMDENLNATWVDICRPMPDSANETLCIHDSSELNTETPASCSPSPCVNGGVCFEVEDRAICRCPDMFVGINCQIELQNQCKSSPCLNGATCEHRRSVFGFAFYLCTCTIEYHGPQCEKVIGGSSNSSSSTTIQPSGDLNYDCHPIPAECHNILPYNHSAGLVVEPDVVVFPQWLLLETYIACSPAAAKVLFCPTAYPDYTITLQSVNPCREICETVKADCEFTYDTLGLPDVYCENLEYSNNSDSGSLCLGMGG